MSPNVARRRAKKNKKRKMRAWKRGKSFAKCSYCGTSEDLDYDPDPFEQEVNGINKRVWLCRSCRESAKNDI